MNCSLTVIMITLECKIRSELLCAPRKYIFKRYSASSHGNVRSIVEAYGILRMPLKATVASIFKGMIAFSVEMHHSQFQAILANEKAQELRLGLR